MNFIKLNLLPCVALLALILTDSLCAGACPRLNERRVKATHNSYHLQRTPQSNNFPAWNYDHASLTAQLEDQDVRGFELDFVCSKEPLPDGSHFHITHVLVFDTLSTCPTLKECLKELRVWSAGVGKGEPAVFVMLEPKSFAGDASSAQFSADIFAQMDSEILSVYSADSVITPDIVRSSPEKSVRESVSGSAGGVWPDLGVTCGQVMFILLSNFAEYIAIDPSGDGLANRLAFPACSLPDSLEAPYCAAIDVSPSRLPDSERVKAVKAAAKAGFILRTRTDVDFPFLLWSDEQIFLGLSNGIDSDGDEIISATEAQQFIVLALNQPIPLDTAQALLVPCANASGQVPTSEMECLLTIPESQLEQGELIPRGPNFPTLEQTIARREAELGLPAHIFSTDYPVLRNDTLDYSVMVDSGLTSNSSEACLCSSDKPPVVSYTVYGGECD